MTTTLFMNPTGEVVEIAQQQQSFVTLLPSGDVNLSDVDTSAPAGKQQGGFGLIWMLVIMLVIMMLFARPRQDKEGEKFRNALQMDQDVITNSGIFGKIKAIDDVSVVLEIAQNTRIRVDKRFINPIPAPQPAKPEKKSRRKAKDASKDEKAK